MNKKSISFIIPIYNSEKTIEDCIESIIKNKKKYDIEIVLINDGSTDNSENVCKKYLEKYKNNIIKYYNFKNQGVSSARNHGIELATKDWIFFIDSDDKLKENAIDYLNYLIEKAQSNIVMLGDGQNIDSDKLNISSNIMKMITLSYKKFEKLKICNNMFYIWTCWGVLYKREFLISENLKFSENLTLRGGYIISSTML